MYRLVFSAGKNAVRKEEKLDADGKNPGGFLRREERPSEHAT